VSRSVRFLLLASVLLLAVAVAVPMLSRSHAPTRVRAAESESRAEPESGRADPDMVARTGQAKLTAIQAAPAAGWAGETVVGTANTWEPGVAADPNAPYVYVIYNDFSDPKQCNTCPSPFMAVRTSSDGGATFGTQVPFCQCPHTGFEYDPIIAVTTSGTVYATFMNDYTIVFTKSTDHGATWSAPLKVSGKISSDKPWMGISKNGTDVYITWTKGTGGDLYEAHSHNGGSSFSTAQMIGTQTGVHYFYSNGLAVLPSGTAVMSASLYPNSNRQASSNPISITTFRTTDGGVTWTRVTLDTVFAGPTYKTSSTTTLTADAAGTLVAEYGGSTTPGANGIIWTQRSTDGGLTWGGKVQITPTSGGGDSSFPAIAAGAAGDFRLTWMDSRTGAWNTWYRSSTNGGVSWGAEVKISDATSGASYKSAAGYTDVYGDYDMIAITNGGKAVAVMGEGASFSTGPGNIWLNRQL